MLLGKKKGQVLEYEQVMLLHVKIAVDLLALDQLREALSAYRNHIQHFSPESFQVILETLLSAANQKVETAAPQQAPDPLLDSVGPEQASPSLCLSFLWNVYGILLDLLKTNGKLVPLYAYTVQSALDFCLRKKLKPESLKLAHALHNHLQALFKLADQRSESPALSYAIDLSDPETSLSLITVRLQAFETLLSMHLLPAALQQAEDITAFRGYMKSLPMAAEVQLVTLMSRWLLATGNMTLHAYVAQHLYWVTFKFSKTATEETLAGLRDAAVISVLSASLNEGKRKETDRYLALLRLGGMPRRQVLLAQSKSRGLIDGANPAIKAIYTLFEDSSNPLSLISAVKSACVALPAEYQVYVPFIHTVAEEIVLKQLPTLYRSITFKSIQAILKVESQAEMEKSLLRAVTSGQIGAKINQQKRLIEFQQEKGLKGFCDQLSEASELLNQFQAVINSNSTPSISMKDALLNARESRLATEKSELAEKLRKERLIELQQAEELAKKQEQESRSKAEESSAVLRRKAGVEQQKQRLIVQRRQLYLEEINYWVEKMEKEGFSSKEMKIKGRKIRDMSEEEKLEAGFEEFVALHKKLFEAARDAREDQMQQTSRQLQYQERAKREVEAAGLLQQWQAEQDSELTQLREQHRLNHQQDLALKQLFSCAIPFKAAFIVQQTEKARGPYEELYQDWVNTQAESISRSILEVAREMREEERKKQQEVRKIETVRRIERDVLSKQEEAKRKLLEESRLLSKETKSEFWRGEAKPVDTQSKRFINSKKEDSKPQTPAIPEAKKQEPLSASRYVKGETMPARLIAEEVKAAPVRLQQLETVPKPFAEAKTDDGKAAGSGYVSRFGKKKGGETKK